MIRSKGRWLVLAVSLAGGSLLHCGGETPGAGSGASSGTGIIGTTGSASGSQASGSASGASGSATSTGASGAGGSGTSGVSSSGTSASGVSSSGGASGASTSGSGSGAASGSSSGTASSGSTTPPPHRPTATACPATNVGLLGQADAGAVSCLKDSDCLGDAGYTLDRYCLKHVCSPDQCLTDGDCAAGSACGCASQFGGNAIHTNLCVPTGCNVDADCPSGLCSPANGGYCGGFTSYHCRSAADTCASQSDCPATKTDAGFSFPNSCSYVPSVGHWQCTPLTVCAG